MSGRRTIVVALGVCATAALAGNVIGGSAGTWLFASTSLLFPALLLALSFEPLERRRLRWMLVALTLLYELSAIGLLLLSDHGTVSIGRVPTATWLMILGFGMLPFVLIVVVYSREGAPHNESGDPP